MLLLLYYVTKSLVLFFSCSPSGGFLQYMSLHHNVLTFTPRMSMSLQASLLVGQRAALPAQALFVCYDSQRELLHWTRIEEDDMWCDYVAEEQRSPAWHWRHRQVFTEKKRVLGWKTKPDNFIKMKWYGSLQWFFNCNILQWLTNKKQPPAPIHTDRPLRHQGLFFLGGVRLLSLL